jgi:beta-lactamase regulating signal transducer with metallopeptidase domain
MIEQIALTTLLNALWLQLVIAALTWVILRCLRHASASTRYGVLGLALIASLLLPVGVALTRVPLGNAATASAAHALTAPATQTAHVMKLPVRLPVAHTTGAPETPTSPAQRTNLAIPHIAARVLLLLWLPIVAALLVRVAVSVGYLERLKRNALPLPVECREHLAHVQPPAGEQVRLCVSDETLVPIAVGWFDAMVLIPKHLTDTLDGDDLARIVLHEIAHLHRRDAVALLLQHVGSALFFFSPGLAWIARQMDLEREIACDDWVVSDGAEATRYATCLIRLAESTPWPHRAAFAPGAFVTRRSMSIRVERILERTRSFGLRAARGPLAVTLLAMGTMGAAAAAVAPSIAFAVPPVPHSAKHVAAVTARVAAKPAAKAAKPAQAAEQPKAAKAAKVTASTPKTPAHIAAVRVGPQVHTQTRVTVTPHTSVAPHAIAAQPAQMPKVWVAETGAPELLAANTPGGDYIDAIQAAFGKHLTIEQLVALKSMGITPDDVTRWHQAGFPDIRANQIIEAKSVGLTPALLASLRAGFGSTLSFEQAVAMQSMHIDTQYAEELKAAGLRSVTPEQIIALKSLGVNRDYITHANAMGFGTLSAGQIEELKSLGIDSAYIQRVRSHGFTNLRLEQLIELKSSGVIQ